MRVRKLEHCGERVLMELEEQNVPYTSGQELLRSTVLCPNFPF